MKRLVYALYLASGYVQLRDTMLSILGRSRVVVLYYHRIGGDDVLSRPLSRFEEDLAYVRRRYECISLGELCTRLAANRPFRRRAAVITFDDGYRDNYTLGVPALERAGLTATFFVATGYVGTGREFPHDHRDEFRKVHDSNGDHEDSQEERRDRPPVIISITHPKLRWSDLRSMELRGFEIGSHTVNHANLASVTAARLSLEVNGSLSALNFELGDRPRPFSFPWGKPADITEEALQMVKAAGYYAAASAFGGSNTRGRDPFEIHRVDLGSARLDRLASRARIAGFDPDYLRLKLGARLSGLIGTLRGMLRGMLRRMLRRRPA